MSMMKILQLTTRLTLVCVTPISFCTWHVYRPTSAWVTLDTVSIHKQGNRSDPTDIVDWYFVSFLNSVLPFIQMQIFGKGIPFDWQIKEAELFVSTDSCDVLLSMIGASGWSKESYSTNQKLFSKKLWKTMSTKHNDTETQTMTH